MSREIDFTMVYEYLYHALMLIHEIAILLGAVVAGFSFIGTYAGVWLGILSLVVWPISEVLMRLIRRKKKKVANKEDEINNKAIVIDAEQKVDTEV